MLRSRCHQKLLHIDKISSFHYMHLFQLSKQGRNRTTKLFGVFLAVVDTTLYTVVYKMMRPNTSTNLAVDVCKLLG